MTSRGFSPTGIRFENIEKRYGGLAALRRIRFEITPGECVALAGRNGSGKTTLLRIAAGLVRPSSGELTFPSVAGGCWRGFAYVEDRGRPDQGQCGFCGSRHHGV